MANTPISIVRAPFAVNLEWHVPIDLDELAEGDWYIKYGTLMVKDHKTGNFKNFAPVVAAGDANFNDLKWPKGEPKVDVIDSECTEDNPITPTMACLQREQVKRLGLSKVFYRVSSPSGAWCL